MSVLIKITLSIFIAYEFYIIFSRKHPAVSVKYRLNSGEGLNPFDKGFDVAVGLLIGSQSFMLDHAGTTVPS